MARTLTGAERAVLAGQTAAHFLRVRVANASGTLVDLRSVGGRDHQLSANVVSGVDTPADTAVVTIRAGVGATSVAPLMTSASANSGGRLLDVGRAIVIDVAVLAVGSTPTTSDWKTVFDGTIDTVSQGDGQRITLSCRNRMLPLLDATVEADVSTTFGLSAEAMLAEVITLAVGTGAPTVVTPVPSGWLPAILKISRGGSAWAAMAQIADQIGWTLRYRWSGNTPELRFFAPNRSLASADWTLAASEIAAVREAALDLAPVRNAIRVGFRTASGATLQIASATDSASALAYGLRRLIIDEASSSQIDTLAEAQVMADAILADLKVPPYSHTLAHRHAFWAAEVGDILDIPANGVTHDATQRLAVVGTDLTIAEGGGSMTLRLRGAPASRTSSWLTLGGGSSTATVDTTTASASFTASGAVRINVIGPPQASTVRAAVSTSAAPSDGDVDAATGGLAASASMAALTSSTTYAVGTTVYVAAAAYIGGVRQRVVQLVVVRDAAAGNVAVGPDLEVRLALDATTATITYVGDGTIELSEDGGVYAAPPASPFTRSRGPQGSDNVRSLTFRAILSGQTISNTVTIPARATVDTDTVAPDLRLIRESAGSDVATFVSYTVQVSNPKAGGPTPVTVGTWRGTLVDRWNGSAWVALTSGDALATGNLLRMTRPANGSEPGTFTVRATISGGGAEEITASIPQLAVVLPPAVLTRVVSSTATTATVRAENVPAGGTVRWTGGTAILLSGLSINTDYASPQDFQYARPAINTGSASATFRGTVNGVSDDDAVTIEEQGRDTVAILTRARVIAIGATTYTVRVSGSAPFGPRTGTLTVTQVNGVTLNGGAVVEGASASLEVAVTDGDYGTAARFVDYVVSRPAIGAQPGRVSFRVSATNCTADTDSVDIEPQRPAAPGRVSVVDQFATGAGYTLRFRAFDVDGTPVTSTARLTATIVVLAGAAGGGGGTTVTWNAANAWFSVAFTRTAGETYVIALVLSASGPTAQTELTAPIPTFAVAGGTGVPRIATCTVFVPTTAGDVELRFTTGDAPAGSTVRASLIFNGNPTGNPVNGTTRGFTNITTGEPIAFGRTTASAPYLTQYRIGAGTISLFDAAGVELHRRAIPETLYFGA